MNFFYSFLGAFDKSFLRLLPKRRLIWISRDSEEAIRYIQMSVVANQGSPWQDICGIQNKFTIISIYL